MQILCSNSWSEIMRIKAIPVGLKKDYITFQRRKCHKIRRTHHAPLGVNFLENAKAETMWIEYTIKTPVPRLRGRGGGVCTPRYFQQLSYCVLVVLSSSLLLLLPLLFIFSFWKKKFKLFIFDNFNSFLRYSWRLIWTFLPLIFMSQYLLKLGHINTNSTTLCVDLLKNSFILKVCKEFL